MAPTSQSVPLQFMRPRIIRAIIILTAHNSNGYDNLLNLWRRCPPVPNALMRPHDEGTQPSLWRRRFRMLSEQAPAGDIRPHAFPKGFGTGSRMIEAPEPFTCP